MSRRPLVDWNQTTPAVTIRWCCGESTQETWSTALACVLAERVCNSISSQRCSVPDHKSSLMAYPLLAFKYKSRAANCNRPSCASDSAHLRNENSRLDSSMLVIAAEILPCAFEVGSVQPSTVRYARSAWLSAPTRGPIPADDGPTLLTIDENSCRAFKTFDPETSALSSGDLRRWSSAAEHKRFNADTLSPASSSNQAHVLHRRTWLPSASAYN